jgi:hypothetical protein
MRKILPIFLPSYEPASSRFHRGLSDTFALGEKKRGPVAVYENAMFWEADDWSIYCGFHDDIMRSTSCDRHFITAELLRMCQSRMPNLCKINVIARELFGSAHAAGCLFPVCDSSVSLVTYDIEAEAFRTTEHRADGGAVR